MTSFSKFSKPFLKVQQIMEFFCWLCFCKILFIYLLAVLGPHCHEGLSLVAASGGYSSCGAWASHCCAFSCCGLSCRGSQTFGRVGSVVVVSGLYGTGSVVVGLSFLRACGTLPDQGSNPRLWHWHADSLPLSHQGSSCCYVFGCEV